jgi:TonB family protein
MVLLKYIESRYPDLAPKASYMVAWILDQVLGVEDSSAYYAYSAVVRNYPETEYAAAAGDRLSARVKEERKPTTPRERPQEPGEQPQETPDTSQQLAQGFPLAPQPKVTGQFVYPEALLSQDLRGKVIFKIKIDISGKVEEYEIIGPSGQHAIDSSATAALLQTEFDTSQLDLSQLDGYFQYSIQFKRPNINIFNDPYRQQREGGP